MQPLTAAERAAIFAVVFSIQLTCVAYFQDKPEYAGLYRDNSRSLRFVWENRARIARLL